MYLFRRESQFHFRYPLVPAPAVAVLLDGFRVSSKPQTIAAPVGRLRELARTPEQQQYPVVAFTGPEYGWLTSADRDLFWEAFGVTVFEQLVLDGRVIAEECEAHDGLHLNIASSRNIDVAGLGFALTPDACACGKATPRLIAARAALAASSSVS